MMKNVQQCFSDGVIFEPMINIAHNYATLENHFGENVFVHRKGATLAREGRLVLFLDHRALNPISFQEKVILNPFHPVHMELEERWDVNRRRKLSI